MLGNGQSLATADSVESESQTRLLIIREPAQTSPRQRLASGGLCAEASLPDANLRARKVRSGAGTIPAVRKVGVALSARGQRRDEFAH